MMSQLTYGGAYSHFETDYNNTGGNKSTDYEGNVNTRGGHKVLTNNSNNNNNNVAMNEQLVLGARRLPPERKVSKSESIHSGHFMISEIEESDTTLGDDDDDDDDDKMVGQDGAGGSSEKELLLPMTTHHESDYEHEPEESSASARLVVSSNAFLHTSLYGPTKVGLAGGTGSGGFVQIDESLAKLFKCMSLAYDGKITSPKWKAFKGVKLTVKDKIRLNNIIWRAWYIQYIAGRNPGVCQFSSPIDSKQHKRSETILLEGKYWKRRVSAVTTEYKKWRMFHQKYIKHPPTPTRPQSSFDWENSLPRWSTNLSFDSMFGSVSYDVQPGTGYELSSGQTNMLTTQPNTFYDYYPYTNSREIARSGMAAEFMQPGLEQLQPNFDFTDTFEPIQDFLSRSHTVLPTVEEEAANFESTLKEETAPGNLLSIFNTEQSGAAGPVNTLTLVDDGDHLTKQLIDSTLAGSEAYQPQQQQQSIFDTAHLQQQQQQTLVTNDGFAFGNNYHHQQPTTVATTLDSSQQQMSKQSNMNSLDDNSNANNNANIYKIPFAPDHISATDFGSTQQQQFNLGNNMSNTSSMSMSNALNDTIGGGQMIPYQPNPINIFYNQPMGNDNNKEMAKVTQVTDYSTFYAPAQGNVPTNNKLSTDNASIEANMFGLGKSNHRSNRNQSTTINNNKSLTIKSLLNKPSIMASMNAEVENNNNNNNNFRRFNTNIFQSAEEPKEPSMAVGKPNNPIARSTSLPIYSSRKADMLLLAGGIQQQQQHQQQHLAQQYPKRGKVGQSVNQLHQLTDNNIGQHNFFPFTNQPQQIVASNVKESSQQSTMIANTGNVNTQSYQPGMNNETSPDMLYLDNSSRMNRSIVPPPPPSASCVPNVFNSLQPSSNSSSPIGSVDSNSQLSIISNNNSNNMAKASMFDVVGTGQSSFPNIFYTTEPTSNKHRSTTPIGGKKSTDFCRPLDYSNLKDRIFGEGITTTTNYRMFSESLPFAPTTKASSSSGSFSRRSSTSPSNDQQQHANKFKQFLNSIQSTSFANNNSNNNFKNLLGDERRPVMSDTRERRRVCHINAEQKRRCNIKNGFDTLRTLLPSMATNTNTKISKAAMLQKAAEYIRILINEKYEQQKESDGLTQLIEEHNQAISVSQGQLPATGAPVLGQRVSQVKEKYEEYVLNRTMQNWKFWIFNIIMESLLDSYCNTVSTGSFEEMCKSLFRWLDQSCCLITLRRDVLNSLRYISTSTNILTNPESLSEEIVRTVNRKRLKFEPEM